MISTILYSTILVVVSLLPLLGVDGWWLAIGLRSQLLGILVMASLMIIFSGLMGHRYFVSLLPQGEE